MLLDDPLERGRITLAIPGAFRIDDGNRTAFADAQAVGLGAQDPALVGEPEFLQPPLEVIPRDGAALHVAALRLGLLGAEKDVTAGDRDSDGGRDLLLRLRHARSKGKCQRSKAMPFDLTFTCEEGQSSVPARS